MAATSSSYTNQQRQFQPHIPKLLYRTPSSETTSAHGSLTAGPTDISSLNASAAPTSPSHSASCSLPASARLSSDASSSNGPNSPSLLPLKTTPPKKKGGSFLHMFTVKEPSTQAFGDYQKQMKKKGASKNGRLTAVGMPGVSSARLPPTVPKVNSKWDGIPQAIKEREKEKDTAVRQSMSGYSRSITTSNSDGSQSRTSSRAASRGPLDHRRNGNLSYSQSSGNLSDMYGWENRSSSSGSVARDFAFATPSPSRDPEFTSFFPRYNSQPQNTPQSITKQSSASLTIPDYYVSPALTPSDSSPATPPLYPSPSVILTSSSPRQDLKDDIRTTTLEIPPNNEEVILKSTGVNILGPPASARRKPKSEPFAEEMKISGKILPIHPILKKNSKPSTVDSLPQLPLSAIALRLQSETPKRPNSVRERLGLGVSVRNATLDFSEQAAEEDDGRDGTPAPPNGQKQKRPSKISLFSK